MDCIIQTTIIGRAMRVTAIDPVSLTEVVFQAPPTTSQIRLRELAAQKLLYVLSKKKGDGA